MPKTAHLVAPELVGAGRPREKTCRVQQLRNRHLVHPEVGNPESVDVVGASQFEGDHRIGREMDVSLTLDVVRGVEQAICAREADAPPEVLARDSNGDRRRQGLVAAGIAALAEGCEEQCGGQPGARSQPFRAPGRGLGSSGHHPDLTRFVPHRESTLAAFGTGTKASRVPDLGALGFLVLRLSALQPDHRRSLLLAGEKAVRCAMQLLRRLGTEPA